MAVSNPLNIAYIGQNSPLNVGNIGTFGYHTFLGVSSDVITDHVQRTLGLLIEQFEDKENINNFLTAIVEPIQEIEYQCNDFLRFRNIDDASGAQLDIVGAIAGEDRNFRTDDEYREAIIIRNILNKSFGEPETIILAVKTITKATQCSYLESYPAGVNINFKTVFSVPSNLREQIESIMLAGVRLGLTQSDDNQDFAFGGEGGFPPEPNTLGFGETGSGYENEGGMFVEQL